MTGAMKGVIGCSLVAFVSGMLYLTPEAENATPTTVEEVMVTEGVTVVVMQEIPVQFRYFDSERELAEFLEQDDTDSVIRFVSQADFSYDCDDYARALRRRALEQGFLMSLQLVSDGEIFGVKVSDFAGPHMGNLSMIGNDIYYIEPSTDEFCLVTAVD